MMRALMLILALLLAAPVAAQGVVLPDPTRVELDNGVTLLLVEKHDVPLIGFEAKIRGGAVTDPAERHGLSNLLGGLLEKGAGDRTAAEFAEAVESVGGELGVSVDIESFSVSGEFLAADAALMVELAADLLRRPALDAAEFGKLRDRSINLIKAAKSGDPGNLLPVYASAFLFGDHPYGNAIAGSEASLAAISAADVRAHYNNFFGGDRLVISVVGDFATADMQQQLTAAFGDWGPADAALPAVPAPEHAGGGQVLLIDKPGATQTYFRIGNVGVARDYPRRADLDLANTVFGGRFTSMLMTELRVKSGLSYGASSILSRPTQPGFVMISSFTETSTTVEALDVALNTLTQLQQAGLDEDMITSARNYVMGQFPPRLETSAQLARQIAALELSGLDTTFVNSYGDLLSAATPESIALAIDDVYPGSGELVFVLIGDADMIRESIQKYGTVSEMSISEPSFRLDR